MCSTEMSEPIKKIVEIEDFDEETVRGMLEYTYTGEEESLEGNFMNLCKITEQYQVISSVPVHFNN